MKTTLSVMLVTAAAFLTGCPEEKKEEATPKAVDAAVTTQAASAIASTPAPSAAPAASSAAPIDAGKPVDAGKSDAALKK